MTDIQTLTTGDAMAMRRHLLADMIRIRVFEERCAELYGESKIRGFLHLYIGEEAVASGVMNCLRPDDAVLATYREHGHALLRGVSADSIMAEMFGKATGCSGGRGGSMHLFDATTRFYGGNAIVGGHLPLAVGLGLADQMLGRSERVTVCFFGEGAMAEGEFHEALNLAALWNVPVLFCCENNRYAMGTSLESSESQIDLALKAASYAIPAWSVDGMDVEEVHRATTKALSSIRAGGGPMFVEFQTYRFRAHSMFDPELYRQPDEVEFWKLRDPIVTFGDRLRAEGAVDDAGIEAMWETARAETEHAVAAADAAPVEPVDTLLEHVLHPGHPHDDHPHDDHPHDGHQPDPSDVQQSDPPGDEPDDEAGDQHGDEDWP
jgi:pyruvate dehydrogenase E1 component alpha subunit